MRDLIIGGPNCPCHRPSEKELERRRKRDEEIIAQVMAKLAEDEQIRNGIIVNQDPGDEND